MRIKAILTEQKQEIEGGGGTGGGSGGLRKIEVTTPPTKTRYLSGESFDKTGMVVTASYAVGPIIIGSAEVPANQYTVTPPTLTDGVKSVSITYMEDGISASCTQEVTVIHALTRIDVTTQPTKTVYEYEELFESNGMVVTATYTDGVTTEITDYTYEPTTKLLTLGPRDITISYTEEGITKTTTCPIEVERQSIPKPTWKNNIPYKDEGDHVQTVTAPSFWNDFNPDFMSISGTTSGINAGTYKATFILGSNYRWADKTTTPIEVDWTIVKATGIISTNPTSITISGGDKLTQIANISTYNTGAISYSPLTKGGITMSLVGKTFTATGDGSTKVNEFNVTISVEGDDNHTEASCILKVAAAYWEWGSETATANELWWEGLQLNLPMMTSAEKQALIGKTKSVTLTSNISVFPQTHLIRCIGVDQDGTNTATFQTANASTSYYTFGSSAIWINSTMRTYCQQYYNAFPGKAYIKTVKKGTCANQNNNRNATPTYNDETVFLPSEREMGLDTYSPLSTANSTTTKAECTYGYNDYYHYYTTDSLRIKKNGDSGGSCNYWERSRYCNTGNSSGVCVVSNGGYANGTGYASLCYWAPALVIG